MYSSWYKTRYAILQRFHGLHHEMYSVALGEELSEIEENVTASVKSYIHVISVR